MQKCNAAAWVLMAFCSTLGFFTIPVMLYPFAILVFWILLCRIFKPDVRHSMTLRRIAKFIVVVAVSTTILYSPVILNSGLGSLIGNRFVTPLPWSEFSGVVLYKLRGNLE